MKQIEGLAVIDEGSGPPLVFSHGTPTWSYEWRHLITGLRAAHRCLAPDHLGFGMSPRPADGDYSPEAHAARFTKVIAALGLERYSLVVHDFGGPIALDGALDHPEQLERLVIFNSFAWPLTEDPSMRRAAAMARSGLFRWGYRHLNLSFLLARFAWGRGPRPDAVWRAYTSRFSTPDDRERVLWALAKSLNASSAFFQSLWERRARLANTPIHVVWGMADGAFPPRVLQRFRSAWPHATITELLRAGHWPHEEEPARCLSELQQFLSTTQQQNG